MDHQRYAIDISAAYGYYEFISVGKKGAIPKGIAFYQSTLNPFEYYCIMGDVFEDGSLDTEIVTDNGDMAKVLATVAAAAAVKKFSNQYPDCFISIQGSNIVRTRLYRMAINANYGVLVVDFDIWGFLKKKI